MLQTKGEIILYHSILVYWCLKIFLFQAMNELNGQLVAGSKLEVSLAKPPSDKKKKEEILRNRERRMMQMQMVHGGRGGPLLGGPPIRGSVPMQAALNSRMGRGDYGKSSRISNVLLGKLSHFLYKLIFKR